MTPLTNGRAEAKTLKQALHDTIHRHPYLTVEAIAEELDMAPSYLYRAALPDHDMEEKASGVRFPAKKIVPLVKVTDDHQVLDAMERMVGRVAIPVPMKKVDADTMLVNAIKAAAEFGDLMREVELSVEDGTVTADERKRVAKEGWEAVRAIMPVICSCQRCDR